MLRNKKFHKWAYPNTEHCKHHMHWYNEAEQIFVPLHEIKHLNLCFLDPKSKQTI